MAVSYGFYNSKNGDRKYDAVAVSKLFDGLITDGVIGSYGNTFKVTPGAGNTVQVDTGRAWFDHTWTLNDAVIVIPCDAAEILLDRYDALVLEVNEETTVRANTIKMVKGSPSSYPTKPSLIKTEHVHQYPLAYILRKAGSLTIDTQYIQNMVGTSECPLATGVLKSMNTDQILAQWDSEFKTWFNGEREILDSDVGAHLNNKIDKLQTYAIPLKANGWSSSAPYSQTVTVPGVTEETNMGPMYFAPTKNKTTDQNLSDALELLSYGVTGENSVTIYCYEAKPTVDITVLADGRI